MNVFNLQKKQTINEIIKINNKYFLISLMSYL